MESLPSYLDLRNILMCSSVFLFLFWYIRRPQRLPPGPWGVPIFGALPTLVLALYRTGLTPHQIFVRLAKKYGDIFSLQLGGTLVVVLNNYDCINEAIQNPHLNDRPRNALGAELNMKPGVLTACGESWKHQRRFTLSTFRNFGVGKRSFEEQILIETKALVNEFTAQEQKPFDPHHLIGNAVSNVICSVIFGKRYEYSDEDFKDLLFNLSQQFEVLGSGGLQMFFPILRYLQPTRHNRSKELISDLHLFLYKIIDEHRKVFDYQNTYDFIDVFLKENFIEQTKNNRRYLNNDTLKTTIAHLFAAGTETTSTTLRWGLLYMIAYPDIQNSIHKEIDSIVGRHRQPQLSDISKLPFTEATLLEIQRIASVVPLGVPHCAAEDTTLKGFHIPKGASLVSNLWAVHNDPDIWEEPSKFNPFRFLDQSGKVKHQRELIPFSTGRRICLGENLAKMELALFFTHLLHEFEFTKPKDSSDFSFEGTAGLTYSPKPFEVMAIPRD